MNRGSFTRRAVCSDLHTHIRIRKTSTRPRQNTSRRPSSGPETMPGFRIRVRFSKFGSGCDPRFLLPRECTHAVFASLQHNTLPLSLSASWLRLRTRRDRDQGNIAWVSDPGDLLEIPDPGKVPVCTFASLQNYRSPMFVYI